MKRSEINRLIRQTMTWLDQMNVKLPPFAFWSASDWKTKGHEYDEIRENMLGWDVTDYGKGNFEKEGLLLFTIRNGNLNKPEFHKPYAEKLLISQVGQVCTNHFHWCKMEDIINRGGGTLRIQLFSRTPDEELDTKDLTVRVDGMIRTVSSGGFIDLSPGESITLEPGQYHSFWAEGEKVLAWEVSMVNDDKKDNRFFEEMVRYTTIEEDEPTEFLLCNEYPPAP